MTRIKGWLGSLGLAAGLGVACAVTMGQAHAQNQAQTQAPNYPTRPIRVVVPFAPGGVVDVTARLLAQKITERLGWQVEIGRAHV